MRVTTPYEGIAFKGWQSASVIPAPLELHNCVVKEEWTDYNDHLSESFFLYIFGDNSDAFFRYFGIDEAYRNSGFSLYTVETHLRHLGQAILGDQINCRIAVIGVSEKKLHIVHLMFRDKELIATAEQMLLHVNMKTERTEPFPIEIQQRLEEIARSHNDLNFDWLGRSIKI